MFDNKKNLVRYNGTISLTDRIRLNGHRSGVIWFTGLPASGKSTIAHLLESELYKLNVRAYVLDGDNVRHGLNSDLGFSREDRKENIRRVAEVARLLYDAGLIVICAFITPFEDDREYVREKFKNDNFVEVYTMCDLKTCEKRDKKGFYKKAKDGLIKYYTGVNSPFEEPQKSHLTINTKQLSIEESVSMLLKFLTKKNFLGLDKR